jgi:hypothetical protein
VESVNDIVSEIQKLEQERDPKCYATASRLEDFMFGTPLTPDARFKKNLLQKSWAKQVWSTASIAAKHKNEPSISKQQLKLSINEQLTFTQDEKQHWRVNFSEGQIVRINKEDKRQYSTIAYALRAILGVQQESMFDSESQLLPLESDAIQLLKDSLDLLSLSALKVSDAQARKQNLHQVDVNSFESVWFVFTKRNDSIESKFKETKTVTDTNDSDSVADLSLVRKIIRQKLESYKAYNQISNQLFLRNLQVYYARLSWPKNKQEGRLIKSLFTETMVQFASDIYLASEAIALRNNHKIILESDVYEMIQKLIPHKINQYEDAIFFPKLAKTEQVVIESYDMDSFRDGGGHWQYLDYVIKTPGFTPKLQPDPFALELLVENIAQFGVLALRVAGDLGKSQNAKKLQQKYLVQALSSIKDKIDKNGLVNSLGEKQNTIVSSIKNNSRKSGNRFSDVTSEVGVSVMHRSSDWLNRLLRSYLEKGKGVGEITIPPAFGGSGIAAEDINNDGFIDLLILSGVGNKLYLNQAGESFKDITLESGIEWRRSLDNTYGEARQPLIADLNNDGLQDIVITYVNDKHRVYQNLGGAKFKDMTAIASLGGDELVGGPATVADFDNDGLLDIYITYFGHYTQGVLPTLKRRNDNGLPNQLFRNLGGFRFENISEKSRTNHTGWAQAVTHTDFNGDGFQDLIVGNDFGVNAYLQNNGKAVFTDVSSILGTDKPSYTMNIGLSDLNQDLQPDIYISNIVTMNKDQKYVLPNENTEMKFNAKKLANMRVVEANDLFLSLVDKSGKVSYQLSEAVGRGYSSTGWSWDADFFDFDNDGDDDLYVLNGMNEFNLYSSDNPYYEDPINNKKKNVYIPVSTKESNVFFINENGKLNNNSQNSGLDLVGNSRSAAYLDFDNDGDLDIALNNYHEPAVFFQNDLDSKEGKWLKIKLVGDVSRGTNRDAIGARIILTTTSGKSIWREIHGSIGYMSVHPKTQHFGLGDESVKNIKIIWPNNQIQTIEALALGKEYIVEQGRHFQKETQANN